MTPTTELLTETQVRGMVDRYLASALGPTYKTGHGQRRDGGWRFMVLCQREDMVCAVAVGGISVDAGTGQIETLTHEQRRNMQEAAAVQAAQERGELARDESGYVLRVHARIKATAWISNRVDLKVGATGGIFMAVEPPIWRFSIQLGTESGDWDPLDVIDVDARTGQVLPLTEPQLELIRGGVRALRRHPELAPAA